jgi:hypothetical protein
MMTGPGGMIIGERYFPVVMIVVIVYGIYIRIRDRERR